MVIDRRRWRVPVALYANAAQGEHNFSAFITSLSVNGMYFDAPRRESMLSPSSGDSADKQSTSVTEQAAEQASAPVHLELRLPGSRDVFWIAGRIVHETWGSLFREGAIKFDVMTERDRERLEHWLRSRVYALQSPDWVADQSIDRALSA